MNGIRGKITVNGQPIDEYAKEQQEKDFTKYINRQIFEVHNEIEETVEDFIYKVLDDHLRETGRGSFSKADLYRAVYLLEEERAGRLVYPWNRWIPVTERLPEEDGRYLCAYKNDAYGDGICIDFGLYEDGEWYVSGAIAWMPLPEPYKEGAEE